MDDNEIEQKQNLLKKAIIDKHYDENEFIQFCLNKKENGDDLSQWSFEEIKNIILEFTTQHSPLNQKEEKEEKEEKKQNEAIKEDIKKMKNVEERPSNTIKINCKKLEKTPLNDRTISVIIQNPKPIETGFLTSNYVIYEVKTIEVDWIVRRRYSDFEWLRSVLVKYHPGQVVPPLPNKKLGTRRFEVDFIEKRMNFLQKFITAVLTSENFKASEPLISFLSMTNRDQFESKMRELTTYQPSSLIEDFRTLSGTITISNDDEEENEKYFKNIRNYFRIQTDLFDRLNFNLKNFYKNIEVACQNMEEVYKDFETLEMLNKKVLMREQITKSYEELGIFIRNWKRILFKQNEIIKIHLKDFFKFIKMEGTSYAELIRNRDQVRGIYVGEKERLYMKKERLWNGKDISKWEIIDEFNKVDRTLLVQSKNYAFNKMCTQETKNLENLQKKVRYANKMNIDELKNMIKINCKKFMDNLKSFNDEFYPSLTDGITVYSGLMMFVGNYS